MGRVSESTRSDGGKTNTICGVRFSRDSLLTSPQLKYAKKAAIEEARVYAIDEIQKMFKKAFRGSKNITYKPGRKARKRTVRPHYVERDVDTEFECECIDQV